MPNNISSQVKIALGVVVKISSQLCLRQTSIFELPVRLVMSSYTPAIYASSVREKY